ncbi:sporulation membrane protein YtaF [Desulforamulus aeronauticus]|uniref:Putative sporulation protein YtaF n=1 Tax=Desulforamulus aeronauticus DSM 10349 TaxID=1121421 RepID=A0A1M6NF68_9FIRM|nr:sporulation membrane protein YtaF [Desulforamulus aeronauticus]SHJ94299.1 putative sporulation protein YtaF [Desulforamulus aeronauticus DSM 10349]
MTWLIILGFALASSIDNLGVGISYGIRGIRIGLSSNFLVAIICFLFSATGIFFGQWLSKVLPGIFPILAGAFFLFVIGIRIILLAAPRKQRISQEVTSDEKPIKAFTEILEYPEKADVDKSGDIGLAEAIILGIALSVNALTNGLGAGLLGLSPFVISLAAAIGSFITVWAGVALGGKVAAIRIGSFTIGQFGTILSGILLVVIATSALL